MIAIILYLGLQLVMAVRRDVRDRMQEHSAGQLIRDSRNADEAEILQEIAECTKLYLTNRCAPDLRVPAM